MTCARYNGVAYTIDRMKRANTTNVQKYRRYGTSIDKVLFLMVGATSEVSVFVAGMIRGMAMTGESVWDKFCNGACAKIVE
jgi:hypothetical protein